MWYLITFILGLAVGTILALLIYTYVYPLIAWWYEEGTESYDMWTKLKRK